MSAKPGLPRDAEIRAARQRIREQGDRRQRAELAEIDRVIRLGGRAVRAENRTAARPVILELASRCSS